MREFTEAILDKIKRLNNMASYIIRFAQPHNLNFRRIDIHTVTDRVLNLKLSSLCYLCAKQEQKNTEDRIS
jgi:nitrogen-specific signal transduction histidine kinase